MVSSFGITLRVDCRTLPRQNSPTFRVPPNPYGAGVMDESMFDDEPIVYLAGQAFPEYDIEPGDHVVVTRLSDTFPLRVVKLKDRKDFVKVMSCGALDRMTLLSGRMRPIPVEPAPKPQLPLKSRPRQRTRSGRQK